MPVAHSSLPFAPSREECELNSLVNQNTTRVLTICNIAWGQTSEPGPSNLPWFPSYPITVSGPIVLANITQLMGSCRVPPHQ